MTGLIGGVSFFRFVHAQTGDGTSIFSGPPLDALLCGGAVERCEAWLKLFSVTTTIGSDAIVFRFH